jgi:catechol 2,3-dioxygenase-like lactoylglutathione lyase family enzyme
MRKTTKGERTMTTNHDTQPVTRGVHHVGLTVPDLAAARRFFLEALHYQQVGEVPDYPGVFLSDGVTMVTLWQAEDSKRAVPFDRKRVIGLHHLALSVENEVSLKDLHRRLQGRDDVEIEFAPEPLGDGPTQHMMSLIPGGIRVEFIAPAN